VGLLPIIYTALTIFTVGLTVILIISYILYKLNPDHKKPYRSKIEESYYLPENYNSTYQQMTKYEEVYVYDDPKRKTRLSENYPQTRKKRFEILNNPYLSKYPSEKFIPRSFNNNPPIYGFIVKNEYSDAEKRVMKIFN
jgi:hypothetical protein